MKNQQDKIVVPSDMLMVARDRWPGAMLNVERSKFDQTGSLGFIVPSRQRRRRKPNANRAIKDVIEAGLDVDVIKIAADGSITIGIRNGDQNENVSALDRWRAKRACKA